MSPVWLVAQASLEKTIQQLNEAYLQALKNGDAEAFANMYSEDGSSLFPGGMIKGRSQILRRQQERMAAVKVIDGSINTLEIEHSGDLACEIGEFRFAIQTKDGSRNFEVVGRFVVVWKRNAAGEWKIHIDAGLPDPPAN